MYPFISMFPFINSKAVFTECMCSDNICFVCTKETMHMQQVQSEYKSYLHPKTTLAMEEEPTSEFNLPGFRFHPTEEELLDFYLRKMALGKNMRFDIIGFLNIYRHDPWDLPGLAKIGEREWYFFVPRDKRHGSGGRPNRTTENGFWKATGSDRKIFSLSDPKRLLGLKKTLVFYKGRAPRGNKTDWVMNEYRLLDTDSCPLPKDIVLCKIYRKATSLKVLEQRAAMEEEFTKGIHHQQPHTPFTPPMDTMSFSSQNYDDVFPDQPMTTSHVASITKEEEDQDLIVRVEEKMKDEVEESEGSVNNNNNGPSLKLPDGMEGLGGLQLQLPKFNVDWTQDSFWTQLRSPWLDNLTLTPYANILNF